MQGLQFADMVSDSLVCEDMAILEAGLNSPMSVDEVHKLFHPVDLKPIKSYLDQFSSPQTSLVVDSNYLKIFAR